MQGSIKKNIKITHTLPYSEITTPGIGENILHDLFGNTMHF